MQTNNKLREAVELAKSTFETLIQFQGVEGFVKTWAGLGRDAMIAALATSATTEKSSAVGDAAKLREALRECAQYIACVGGIGVGEVTINDNVHLIPEELTQKAIAALSATEKEGGAK